MRSAITAKILAPVLVALASCSALEGELPIESPPLADMEEPLALFQEPDDESERVALPPGSFTGLEVEDARDSLEALAGEAHGVRISRVVENSPAAAAGIEMGELLVEVDDGVESVPVRSPAAWREIELERAPGTRLTLVLERLGTEREVELVLEPRTAPAARTSAPRLREEERVGIAVRALTEVEARAAGLGPGGGASVVGLSRGSPWRAAGVELGDQIVALEGRPLASPAELLDRIRAAPEEETLELEVLRQGGKRTIEAPVSRRARELQSFSVPLIVSYSSDPDRTRFSMIFGIVRWDSTPAAWRMRLLWFISFGGGDTDRLLEVER